MSPALPEGAFSAGAILARTFGLLGSTAFRVAVAGLVLVAIGMVIDTGVAGPQGDALNLVASGAALIAQYRLTRMLLEDLAEGPVAGGGFGAFFGLGIVSVLGILLGLVLFVIPGIVLMVRWSISTPILLASDEGVFGSMQQSWRATEGRFWPILLAYLAFWLPGIALAAGGSMLLERTPGSLAGALLFNVGVSGAVITSWYAAVAIFSLIAGPDLLADVFA